MTRRFPLPAIVLLSLIGLGIGLPAAYEDQLDVRATEFTRLALAFAQHKPEEVDSYFGPPSLRPAANAPRTALPVLSQRAHRLVAQLEATPSPTADADPDDASADAARARQQRLLGEARALATSIEAAVAGTHAAPRQSFDEEARETYGMKADAEGAAPAAVTQAQIDVALAALDRALPLASQPLASRFEAHRRRLQVPADRRRVVFEAALQACRARTVEHWTLPAGEHLDVKWDISAPAAWHRYDGHGRGTLTINPAAVSVIDNAIDLACHEGYPGHHAQFLLMESASGPRGLPIENAIALLRSPEAMLREAAANYAVDLAFPPDERERFERETLFPLAGLDPASAAADFEVRRLVRALEPAIVPILRDYRDGRLAAAEASDQLVRRALVTSPQALLRFVDDLGPYVLGYTVARDRVASYVGSETRAGRGDAWTVLAALLKAPDPARVLSSTSSRLSAAR